MRPAGADEQPHRLIAIFGPTAVGKTAIAIELAERLRREGEDPVAVSCDSIQIYRGLETLSGAATPSEQRRLEHRLISFLDVGEEFSAGRFAAMARAEIDSLLEAGRRPIVVGGTGLYLRAALSNLELRPPVSAEVRRGVEREIDESGAAALHTQIERSLATGIHPNDRKRVARALELQRAGIEAAPTQAAGGRLWTATLRHPTLLAGIILDGEELDARIDARVDRMAAAGAVPEARAAGEAGASRTASAALGFEALIEGDLDAVKQAHRRYVRRQLTWMRRMDGVQVIDRGRRRDADIAAEIAAQLSDTGRR